MLCSKRLFLSQFFPSSKCFFKYSSTISSSKYFNYSSSKCFKYTSPKTNNSEYLPFKSCKSKMASPNEEDRPNKTKTGHKRFKNKEEVEEIPKKKHANWFVAVQISNPTILEKLTSIQDHIVDQEPRLKSWIVSVCKSHVTMSVFHAEEDQLGQLENIIEESVLEYRSNNSGKIDVHLKGLGHFNNKVLFAKLEFPESENENRFWSLWQSIANRLFEAGFITQLDAKASEFSHHVTIMKPVRDRPKGSQQRIWKIAPELYSEKIDQNFGPESFASVQLLSMEKPKDASTGYYFCHREFKLMDPQSQNDKAVETKSTSSASGSSTSDIQSVIESTTSDDNQSIASSTNSTFGSVGIDSAIPSTDSSLSDEKTKVKDAIREAIMTQLNIKLG